MNAGRKILGAVCLLTLMGLGCSDKPKVPPAPIVATPPVATPPALALDAGPPAPPTAALGTADGGSAPSPGDRALQLVPELSPRTYANEQAFVREHALDEEWEVTPERLASYWHPAVQLEGGKLGQFTLGQLSDAGQPRGGHQLWMLLRRVDQPLTAYGPLLVQQPFTPDYQHKTKAVRMELRSINDSAGKLLWVQLQDKLTTRLDDSGEQVESNTRLLDYGFLVEDGREFTPVFFQLPEKVTRALNDETTAESSLEVSLPSSSRLVLKAKDEAPSREQVRWIGEHSLGK